MKTIYTVFTLFLLPWMMVIGKDHDVVRKNEKHGRTYVFYLGTYTQGASRGIYKYCLSGKGTLQPEGLQARTSNPSYLTFSADRRYLLAVNENAPGTVSLFAVHPDRLVFLGSRRSGGDAPCYVSVNAAGWVLTANYGSGTVGLLRLDSCGKLSPLLFTQKHFCDSCLPHAHAAQFIPGTRQVVATDLGTDQLWFSKLDEKSNRLFFNRQQQTLRFAKGTGPRHFVFYPGGKWLYLVGEEGNNVTVVGKSKSGRWQKIHTYSTLPGHFQGKSYAADVHLSPDARFLYVSNRGSNTLAIFRITEKGKSLQCIDYVPVHGNWPRNFALTSDGNFLVVANQKSNNIVVFKRNKVSGKLLYCGETKADSPVCILFVPGFE